MPIFSFLSLLLRDCDATIEPIPGWRITRDFSTSSPIARLIVGRLVPYCTASAFSDGSGMPGNSLPS